MVANRGSATEKLIREIGKFYSPAESKKNSPERVKLIKHSSLCASKSSVAIIICIRYLIKVVVVVIINLKKKRY